MTRLWSMGPMVLEETDSWPDHVVQHFERVQHIAEPDDLRPCLRIRSWTVGAEGERQRILVNELDVRVEDNSVTVSSPECFRATLDLDTLCADVHVTQYAKEPLITWINPLRGFVTAVLPLVYDGLMFHASSAVLDGKGLVFAGVSGQGKTTLSTNLKDAKYISDDISLVQGLSKTPRVIASPFYGSAGRLGYEISGDFAGLALLEQSQDGQTHVETLERIDAVQEVMRHVVCFSAGKNVQGAILGRVMDLVERVPVVRLTRALETAPDEVFAQTLAHVTR